VDESRVIVGRVSGLFGIKGWVKVYSYTSPPENIVRYAPWFLQWPERGNDSGTIVSIAENRRQGKGLVVRFEGVEDRESASEWIGGDIFVDRDKFEVPVEGEYYWSDMTGLEVRTADGQVLGIVESMIETGANDVMVVEGDRRRLVPFLLGDVVKKVDIDAREVIVDWNPDF
jgi:16S rRNA processing protein RimM